MAVERLCHMPPPDAPPNRHLTASFLRNEERDLIDVRKPDKGADIAPGMRFLCDRDKYWLPVEILSLPAAGNVQVRWVGFDDRWKETVSCARLRLPLQKPSRQLGPNNTEPPGEPASMLTDFRSGSQVYLRRGFEWQKVSVVDFVGLDYVMVRPLDSQAEPQKVERDDLRIETLASGAGN
jgi:hypothetical protein